MSLSRIKAIFIRQLYLIRSTPTRIFGYFIWLVIDIILWGFITKYLDTLGQAVMSFTTVILGAVILWGFWNRVQSGVMMAFLEDIWSRNFFNFFASPLTIGEYLAGLVASSAVVGAVGLVVIAAIAGLGFGYNVFLMGLAAVPAVLILFVFAMAMGIALAALIFRLGPAAEWLGWPMPMILSVFSGVYYPVSTMPLALRVPAALVPSSYVFEALRAAIAGGSGLAHSLPGLALGGGLALFYLYLSYRFFLAVYRYNMRAGKIARFSAE